MDVSKVGRLDEITTEVNSWYRIQNESLEDLKGILKDSQELKKHLLEECNKSLIGSL